MLQIPIEFSSHTQTDIDLRKIFNTQKQSYLCQI
jgi:hypothetical protein